MLDPSAYWNDKTVIEISDPRRNIRSFISAEHLPSGCILYHVKWPEARMGRRWQALHLQMQDRPPNRPSHTTRL
jgi:hypothetical protein